MRRSAPPTGDAWCWSAFIVAGFIATGLSGAGLSPLVTAGSFGFIGLGSMIALLVGPLWHRAEPKRAWLLLAASAMLFVLGGLLRPWAASQDGPRALLADVFTAPAYLVIIAALATLLRARRAIERHAVIDGFVVFVAAALGSALLLAAPAASLGGRSPIVSALAGLYPIFDVVLVLLLVNLAFTTAARRPSFVMVVAAIILMLAGDLAYAIIGITGDLTGPRLLDLPFALAFTLMGAAALHPSVVDLGRATPLPVQAWSWRRMLLLLPALAVPFVLLIWIGGDSTVNRVVLTVGGAVMVGLLIARAISAVNGYVTAQRRFEHQARHDPLTGLPNRRVLSAEIDRLLGATDGLRAPPWQVWVYFLDLDGFKLVNDSWGHHAGDELIVEVAGRLAAAIPPTATVARVGGDEFVLVYPGSQQEAMELAERIMACLREPLRLRGAQVVISASAGIACAQPGSADTVTAESLMRDADTAMYRAKFEGRGRWTLFDASMHELVRERVDIEAALRQALLQNELHLAYQPIVDLSSGAVLGAEALIRWDHPVRGPVPPAAFIPVAEDTGLIKPIGGWVLREAIGQLAAWRADGTVTTDFWISINVSPRQLRDPDLPSSLAREFDRYGVPADRVVLEITESVMIDGSSVTDRVLHELRGLGLRIAVDDFGTGFSALGYLRRHPVTGVKIDRAFVSGLGASSEDEEIVRAVVAMCAALGLAVVAEGVETAIQRDVLAALGVRLGQGRLWGFPIAAGQFASHWAKSTALRPHPTVSTVVAGSADGGAEPPG